MFRLHMLRKLAVPLSLALTFLATAPSVSAAALPATTFSRTTRQVNWSMTPAGCPSLPLPISGSGVGVTELTTMVKADGSQHIEDQDKVTGTAVDSTGASYSFLYVNHSSLDVPPSGSPTQILMVDDFLLRGTGRDTEHVAFTWSWTYTTQQWPPVTNWRQIHTLGDPMNCDPI